jgi:hypothetical protein
MQPETAAELRAKARELRDTADWYAQRGCSSLFRHYRAIADDYDQRAARLEKPAS